MAVAERLSDLKPADLPAPPQSALNILRACADPEITNPALAELVSLDAALTAELLRVANSAFFATSKPVQSVANAVTVLGMRALRNLVLCLTMRDVLKPEQIAGLEMDAFWEDSLRRAVSARLLGKTLGLNAEDCFTAGLLQDVGLPVLFLLNHGSVNTDWRQFSNLDPQQRHQQEIDTFGLGHDDVVGLLARAWNLPATLCDALATHHQQADEFDQPELASVLHLADWIAAIFTAEDKSQTLDTTLALLAGPLAGKSLSPDELLEAIPAAVTEAARTLGLHVQQQPDINDIMRAANARLAEENLSYQELTWRLQQTLRERDALAAELDRELALAREIQQRLMPAAQGDDFPIHGMNIPARELSGDFFDYFTLPDGSIYFTLGDVSGKGANAALLMTKTASLFRGLGKDIHHPGQLAARINAEILETVSHGMFVTLIIGLLDKDRNQIKLVNAGHPPALLLRPNAKPASLGAEAPPLGIMEQTTYPVKRFSLDGGSLYLFSDGLLESRHEDGSQLGLGGFLQLLITHAEVTPAQRLAAIVQDIPTSAARKDDITLLLIEAGHGQ